MARILSKEEWNRRRRNRNILMLIIIIALAFVIAALLLLLIFKLLYGELGSSYSKKETITDTLLNGETIKLDYLTRNQYSRPGTKLKRINGIVVHYTANPGTSAENNRSYFVIQIIPLTEESYASNDRNDDTIAIECCHPDETGEFNDKT